ncbi:MAG: cytochrome c oxidase assembly protein [Xanthomonadales bacterium]|nr:cytochrome c oxidase assembly protein [Xanthomonadales bacterium]
MNMLAWLVPWEPSPTVVICLLLAAGLYVRGAWLSPKTAPWPRQLAFWIGLLLVYIGLQTHFGYYAQYEFFMHRLQHLGLHHMGPFLIALAYPGAALRRGLPLRFRVHVLDPLLATWPLRWTFNFLLHPLVATLLFFGLIYFWLWPSVHFIAMLDKHYYTAMNWSVTIDGFLFWWLILDPRPRPPARLAPGMRILVALAVIPPQIVLGAYMVFTQRELYTIYAVCGRVFPDISPALDQHLGGLILWIPSAMMSVIAALIALAHWTSLSRRQRLPQRDRLAQQQGFDVDQDG